MHINEWLNEKLDFSLIKTEDNSFPVLALNRLVYFPLELNAFKSLENGQNPLTQIAETTNEDGKAFIFLIETDYDFKNELDIFSMGLETALGELGKVPVLILHPFLGLYQLHQTLQIFNSQVKDKGKAIVIVLPETEKYLIELAERVITSTHKNLKWKYAQVDTKKVEIESETQKE